MAGYGDFQWQGRHKRHNTIDIKFPKAKQEVIILDTETERWGWEIPRGAETYLNPISIASNANTVTVSKEANPVVNLVEVPKLTSEKERLKVKIEAIENSLLKYGLMYLSFSESFYKYSRKHDDNNLIIYPDLKDFIVDFLNRTNWAYNTYRFGTNNRVCDPAKSRSIGDIFLICRYYYPLCPLLEVIKTLVSIDKETFVKINEDTWRNEFPIQNMETYRQKCHGYIFFYCKNTGKRVFARNNEQFMSTYTLNRERDELKLSDTELYLTLDL